MLSKLVGDFMDPLGKHQSSWEALARNNDEAGAHSLRASLEGYVEKAILARSVLATLVSLISKIYQNVWSMILLNIQ